MRLSADLEAAQHARQQDAIRLQAELGVKTIAVQAGPRAHADEPMLTSIRGAVLAQQPLGFTYARPGAEPRRRSVTPCGVMFGRANYLVAADRETGRIQTFRLDRMSHVAPQEGVAAPPPDFDLSVFARLRRKRLIESRAGSPYRISRKGRLSVRAQLDNQGG